MKHFLLALLVAWGLSDLARSSSTTLLRSGQWSVATNWSPASVPGSTNDVSVNSQRFATVSTNVGSVRTVTLGNASGEGALNVDGSSAALDVLNGTGVSVLVGGPGIAGTQVNPFPSYYSHVDGRFRTSGDLVIGTNALSGEAFFNKGTLGVGGALRVGAQEAGLSQFKVRGGGSGASALGANRLEIGARGQLVFDFLGGAEVLPITVTNQVGLASGSALVVANMVNAPAGTYTLINGGSLSGTFSSVETPGLPFTRAAQIVYDQGAGDVLLVVSDTITEFDNFTGDRLWRNPDNWFPSYPDPAATGRLIADAVVDAAVEIGYLESGTSSLNSALNLFSGGFLQVNEPGVSMVIGVVANGPGAPNYYNHAAGTLTTAGDLVLGANGGKAEAQFSSGTLQVGGSVRVGSYQNAGSSGLRILGGGGTISAKHLEVGANGQLIFDFIGGVSLKTLNVTNNIAILPDARLSITNTSGNPSPLVATTYTLIQGASLSGSFSQVEISGYPASLNPRIVYSSTAVRLVVEPTDPNVPPVDGGTSRLGGYSRVVPLGAAGWSFGTAAAGEEIYYADYDAGTITMVVNGVQTSVLTNWRGIYGLALKGDKMYFSRETDFVRGNAAIFEMTRSGSGWGAPRQVLDGIFRPRQLYVENSGDLLVPVETGQILRVNPVAGTATTLVTGLSAPQAAVSDSAGNLYFNEYGSTTADGTPTALGTLWKLPAGSSTKTQLWQGNRLRGLAWVPGSQERLVQLTEANRDDQGNSSTTAILSTNGSLLSTISGLDYPQFTGVTASGNVVTTSPRDRALLKILPGTASGSDEPLALRTGVDCFATLKGSVHRIDGTGRSAVTLTGLAGGSLTFYVTPDEGGNFAGWIRMVKSEWPAVSTAELQAGAGKPGFYEVPQPGIQTSGVVDRLQVLAHRSRNISRWPMTNVGTVNESPQPGFSEIPDGYLAYVEVSGLPATPVVNPAIVWDGGGGTNYAWSTPANWSGDVLPGAGDDVVLKGIVQVNSPAGPVGDVLAGDATNNVSLDMIAPGALAARSLTVGGANNPSSFPNYFYGNGGSITTTEDLVVGANGAKIEGVYTSGDISVGGALRIGSGYTASDSSWVLRGASGAINSGSLVIGGGVQLVMDFIGGNSMRTLTATNGVMLEAGSRLKVVGNANTGVGNNVRLINGGSNQLTGTFTSVTFEGFPADTLPRIEYNAVDGDVWLVVGSKPAIVWDGGGGTNYSWSTPANWSGDVLPGAGDDVVLKSIVQVNSPVGPVGHVLAGDATNNVSLDMIAPGSLAARSLTVGGANNPSSFPNYFYGNGGSITTTEDLVVGANGARMEGVYTSGDISVGGALRIGSGYTASDSSWVLRGASGAINSDSLVIGGGVQLIMDFIGGNSMRTLTATNGVMLEAGSRLKVVGNANTGVGNNVRLINGGSNQLAGTFGSVTFEGFPANTLPRIEYNAVDGDVWLVVGGSTPPTPFDEWSGTTNNAPDASILPSYAVGGAVGPNAPGQAPASGMDGPKFYLSAIVRTNDPNLTITGQSAVLLSGPWSDLAVDPQGVPSANTTNVPEGCQRRTFSVDRGVNSKLFLRLRISWQ